MKHLLADMRQENRAEAMERRFWFSWAWRTEGKKDSDGSVSRSLLMRLVRRWNVQWRKWWNREALCGLTAGRGTTGWPPKDSISMSSHFVSIDESHGRVASSFIV